MPKAVKYSDMAREIKKEYLTRHLDSVEKLITKWIPQLDAPNPLSPVEATFGRWSVYKPKLEYDPDNNHIIHRHVRSRALWRYHADWERRLNEVWSLIVQLRQIVLDKYPTEYHDVSPDCQQNFFNIALWVAFESHRQKKQPRINYKVPNDEVGIACGNFKIHSTAVTETDRNEIQKEHLSYTKSITQSDPLKHLAESWSEIERLQLHMGQMAAPAKIG